MKAQQFKQIRQRLPVEIARSNISLGAMLGVSHHSISKYQNMQNHLPAYIANGMLMLELICQNNLLGELQEELDPLI